MLLDFFVGIPMEVCEKIIFIEGVGFNSNIYIIGKSEIGIIDTGASATCIDSIFKYTGGVDYRILL